MNHDPRLRDGETTIDRPREAGSEVSESVLATLLAVHGNQEVLGAAVGDGAVAAQGGGLSSLARESFEHLASVLGAEAFAPGLTTSSAGEVDALATPDVTGGTPQQVKVVERAIHAAEALAKEGVRRTEPRNDRDRVVAWYNLFSMEEEHLSQARSVLQTTLDGLGGKVSIQIDDWTPPRLWGDGDTLGWVWGVPGTWTTEIHVTPKFFDEPQGMQAWVVLHEATHRFAGTVDHGYYKPDRPKLTVDQALENADSVSAFSVGFLGGEAVERLKRAQVAAAEEHAGVLFDVWEAGDIELYTDGWTAPDGLDIPPDIVADAVFLHFRRDREEDYKEVAAATATQEEGPFTCSSGLVVRKDLYECVYYYELKGLK